MDLPGGLTLAEALDRLPRIELHCHVEGTMRPDTLAEFAAKSGRELGTSDPRELYSFDSLEDHPWPRMAEAGLHLTLNSDDPAFMSSDLGGSGRAHPFDRSVRESTGLSGERTASGRPTAVVTQPACSAPRRPRHVARRQQHHFEGPVHPWRPFLARLIARRTAARADLVAHTAAVSAERIVPGERLDESRAAGRRALESADASATAGHQADPGQVAAVATIDPINRIACSSVSP